MERNCKKRSPQFLLVLSLSLLFSIYLIPWYYSFSILVCLVLSLLSFSPFQYLFYLQLFVFLRFSFVFSLSNSHTSLPTMHSQTLAKHDRAVVVDSRHTCSNPTSIVFSLFLPFSISAHLSFSCSLIRFFVDFFFKTFSETHLRLKKVVNFTKFRDYSKLVSEYTNCNVVSTF